MNVSLATVGLSATIVQPLLTPVQVGPYRLRNRTVMAPLTRMRAGAGGVPQSMNALYYRQRASAGLVISEATPISAGAVGYIHQPGIFNEAQVEGWKQVTEAVHAEGGTIFLQLFHPGRMSHPLLLNGQLPVAPSVLASGESSPTAAGMQPHPLPRALATEEIAGIVANYARAA
ncbi:MAG: alkene reductase, partial [Gemmatimonadaceae bacterium]|nr:alkene reductase [Gloeobacterales cyanobacterium ES-bin-141]